MTDPIEPVEPAQDDTEPPARPGPFDPAAPAETTAKASHRAQDGPEPGEASHPLAGEFINPEAPVGPEWHGPYNAAEFGTDAKGDPVNAYGRSEPTNLGPWTEEER
jgi:hypothetical protein